MSTRTRDVLIVLVFLAAFIGYGLWSMSGDTTDSDGTYPMEQDYGPAGG